MRQPEKGDIICYIYRGRPEYSRWNGDGTHTLLGPVQPRAERILKGVWKRDEFQVRKVIKP